MNDHLRSGKSISSTDNVEMNVDVNVNVDMNVDVDADADAAKVVGFVKAAVGSPSTGYEVAK